MYKIIYPTNDTTIYERFPDTNTSVDQILELWSIKNGEPVKISDETEYWPSTYNSRILLKFNVSTLNSLINGRTFEAYLNVNATESTNLNTTYTLYSYPLSGSFGEGSGFFSSNPKKTNGCTWYNKNTLTAWQTSSYNVNSTGSYSTHVGGGTWYTNVSASQTFSHESPDVFMNVTNILHSWLSGSIPNDGFIMKFHDTDEQSLDPMGRLQFFSNETHTIYIPKLIIYWNDTVLTNTGSFSEVNQTDRIYIKNLKEYYHQNEVPVIRIGGYEKYPTQTYSTSSNYLVTKRLPINSYYAIADDNTYEYVLPMNTLGTQISCDSNGNYFKMDCSNLLPERYYKLVLVSNFADGSVSYFDKNYIFRVIK